MRDWLRELRKKSGMTQQEVAEQLHIAANSYSIVETGQRQSKMTIEFAQKLAQIFDIPFEYILEHENKTA